MTKIHLKLHPFTLSSLKIREGKSDIINQSTCLTTLIYTASGEGNLLKGGRLFPITEGKSYIISEECVLTSTSSNLLTVYSISWEKDLEDLSFLLSVALADQQPAKLVPLWESALKTQTGGSISERCRFQSTVWSILSFLTDHTEVDEIEETKKMITNNISNPYSIEKLADKAKMNPTSFIRAFKKRVGMTPKEYLIEERMRSAKVLMLQNKGITTKDVSMSIGVQDEFYFSRLFKQKVGLPPSIFMKRSKQRIAVVSQVLLQDHLLSLGIQPVAAPAYPSIFPSTNGLPRYLEKELEGTVLLNAENMFQPEEILKTQPDHIIKTPLHNGEIQSVLLSHQQKVQHISLKTQWNEYLREIASLTGQESRVDSIEKEVSLLELKVKDEICPMTRKGKWAVIWIREGEIRLYGMRDHACLDLLYQKLGFDPHPDLPNNGYRIVSVKELAELNANKLLILWSHEKDVWKVVRNKEWKKIKAVENKEVYYPNSFEWDPWGPLGRKNMLINFAVTLQNSKLIF
ncbi:AraC family transcriptional regulator [Metabacillus litoralis]|uniref:AraC family transcriptional regulator n=1 Tax=Metabacillus litoralis TaxID=152268 RepID=UPI001CFF38F3|nr:AraC family transcriptional regulator [Metabacillus litoralis]